MFNYSTADGNGFESILKKIHAPFGIFAIKGNHDYGDYIKWESAQLKSRDMEDLREFYRDLGWKLLENCNEIIEKEGDSIAVIGVENWGASHRVQRLADVDKARWGVETMSVQLLLSHDPSHWDSIVTNRYPEIDVTFAGHTHGGQIGFECGNFQFSLVRLFSRLWGGIYQNHSGQTTQYLYVNRGLGNIGYAGRIGIMPEITLITLLSP
jgi:predicted MPP superfamily phosphohydrolase